MPSNFQRILIPPFCRVPEPLFISSVPETLWHKNEVKQVTTENFFFFFLSSFGGAEPQYSIYPFIQTSMSCCLPHLLVWGRRGHRQNGKGSEWRSVVGQLTGESSHSRRKKSLTWIWRTVTFLSQSWLELASRTTGIICAGNRRSVFVGL